jgi:8-oxo-dGTP diphosphatase
MPPPYCYEYPRPAVTVDLAVFALQGESLRILLIRRGNDPFKGRWALPGGFVEIDEPIDAAARRELHEETGLQVNGPVAMIGVFGDPGRDPRGRTISVAHATTVRRPLRAVRGSDDASEAAWLDPRATLELAFDHARIVATALDWLARAVDLGPAGLALLPTRFDDDDVRRLFKAVGKPLRAGVPGVPGKYRSVAR